MKTPTWEFIKATCIEDADCLRWPHGNNQHVEGKPVWMPRYVFAMHYGQNRLKACVWRTCETPNCLNPKHLCSGTRAQMMGAHAAKGSLKGRARKHPHMRHWKLDQDKARQIRELAAEGLSQTEIASRFGVTQSSVSLVVLGKTWREPAWKGLGARA